MNIQDYKKEIAKERSEHSIQTEIMGYLRAKGYYVMRLNSGKYSVGEGRAKRFVMGQEAGTPDLMAFKGFAWGDEAREVDLLFIEVKRPKKLPTPLQEAKMRELEEYGARCIVAHSVEEVQKEIE